ncbi:hypothetical protein KC318_g42 [Hortaea werneckii]|nr:hypothetical protein KC355_g42 [Hortaea werneckii]KAI7676772.1 hypothetical protein KC318_g42 [Hortaea werneckii]
MECGRRKRKGTTVRAIGGDDNIDTNLFESNNFFDQSIHCRPPSSTEICVIRPETSSKPSSVTLLIDLLVHRIHQLRVRRSSGFQVYRLFCRVLRRRHVPSNLVNHDPPGFVGLSAVIEAFVDHQHIIRRDLVVGKISHYKARDVWLWGFDVEQLRSLIDCHCFCEGLVVDFDVQLLRLRLYADAIEKVGEGCCEPRRRSRFAMLRWCTQVDVDDRHGASDDSLRSARDVDCEEERDNSRTFRQFSLFVDRTIAPFVEGRGNGEKYL